MSGEIILRARGLKKHYGKDGSGVYALRGVDLDIGRGSFTVVVGTSGSGKSTLLNILGGLDTPDEGEVWVAGTRLSDLDEKQLTIFRRRQIGFVFQNHNLVEDLSVWENIIFPVCMDGRSPDRVFAGQVVRLLGLEARLGSFPGQLSGGQRQRVAIARALAARPSLILADEPTGNLDSKTSDDVVGLMKMSARVYGQTVVMITHDGEIAALADRVLQIEDGRIVSERRQGRDYGTGLPGWRE